MVVGDAAAGVPPRSVASVFVPNGEPDPHFGFHSGSNLELGGDYSGHVWNISFDLRLMHGPAEALELRYTTYDYPHVWYMPLAIPELGVWTHYAVEFDPDWTDDEAFAAGWMRHGLGYASFAQSMRWVTGTQVYMDLADGATTALLNMDNFVQQHGGSQVPVPATAALVLLALAGLAGRRAGGPARRPA